MHEFGSIVAFDLAGGAEAVRAFADALEFFAITPSIGSVESLMLPPQLLRGRGFSKEQVAISGVGEGTVRLSIGIEDADDLIGDLGAALAQAGG
jgi:cystathionine gamma-synthase